MDFLYLQCVELSARIGQDFCAETLDILGTMRFDAGRRDAFKTLGRPSILKAAVLDHHYCLLDIRGTVKGALKRGQLWQL